MQVGYEIATHSPLSIRPSVGIGFREVSSLRLDCRTSEGCWNCAYPGAFPLPDAEVHTNGQALVSGIALALGYRAQGLRTTPGSGFRLSLDHARGASAEQGQASFSKPGATGAESATWTTESTQWSGWRFAVQAGLSWGF